MPSAPPSSRTVSFTADATPCLSGGNAPVIAVVDGARPSPKPEPEHHQAGEHRRERQGVGLERDHRDADSGQDLATADGRPPARTERRGEDRAGRRPASGRRSARAMPRTGQRRSRGPTAGIGSG